MGHVGEPLVSGNADIVLVPQVFGKKDVRSDLIGDRGTCDNVM